MRLAIVILFGIGGTLGYSTAARAALVGFEAQVLSDNPFLYYRLGESSGTTAIDASGNLRNGTHVGGPSFGAPGYQGGDTAISYDGSNDRTLTGGFGSWGSQLDNHSVEMIFSGLTPKSSIERLLGVYRTGGSSSAYQLSANVQGNSAGSTALFYREGSGGGRHAVIFDESEVNIYDGGYHHLVFTFDQSLPAADRMSVYANGVKLTSSLTVTASNTTPGNELDFDFEMAIAARNLRGSIDSFAEVTFDELVLYDKTLTASDVSRHFNAAFIPEPSSLLTYSAFGILGLGMAGRRARRS
ncbi:MAG: LamG-like jellyroll fold domain-containing protein [Planctomycetota bacterium]